MSERDITKWNQWQDLSDEVLRYVPDVDIPNLVFACRDASVEFFEETHAWRYTVEENLPIQAGQPLYTPPIPDTCLLAGVGYVGYFDPQATQPRPLWPITENELKKMTRVVPATAAALGWLDDTGPPLNYLVWNDHTSLRIYRVPTTNDVGGQLTEMILYLNPGRKSQGLPVYLMDRFYREIAVGAASYLRALPDQKWSSTQLANDFEAMFNDMKIKTINALRRNRTEAQPTGGAAYPLA